ncbi:glycoside hydrolase [Haloarculaceae archaeon H-GB2-1]|nr:glycoside hydrolase [Haloarculaceae archaeon H-GB1-1]MEA5408502.1 glycoside hydrolase [Haloarculaceae archaeon H-GB2-1]
MVAENADDDSGSRDVSTRRRRYLALTGVTLGGLTAVTWAASRNRTSAGPADHRAANGQSTGRSGQPADSTTSEQQSPIDSPVPTVSDRVRGAIYLPARAFNGYQIWAFYDPAETRRDLRYATRLRLNALRTFASYEYWRDHPERYRDRFDDFLDAAGDAGVAVLPVLFESIGDAPTEENLTDRNLETSFAVHSPDRRIIRDRSRWGGPRSFVEWFAARYGDRDELLALEIMNEPGMVDRRVAFCRAMLRTARNAHATVPLTMGCRDLSFTRQYSDPALDVLQFHHNLPRTVEDMRAALDAAVRHSNRTDTPVWLSEWQRTRQRPPDPMLPNYESLAGTIRDSDLDGDFLWQLLLKPAYMERPRKAGRLNGVFHEDGVPYSAADAAAIAGQDEHFDGERRGWPSWIADPDTDS